MNKFNPAILAVKQTSGAFEVTYIITDTNGKKYQHNGVTLSNITSGCFIGVKAIVEIEEISGTTNEFEATFTMSTSYNFDATNEFLQVTIKEDVSGELERRGGGIIRHKDSDQ